jgi:hypothetical protein
MSEQIEKPIKRLAKDLLKDAEVAEGLLAVVFAPDGGVKVHGAGVVHEVPELVLFGAARLIAALMGSFKPGPAGQFAVDMKEGGECQFQTAGSADEDPRVTLHMIVQTLIALTEIIRTQDNLVKEQVASTETEAENSNNP